jgi:hypothetical protein
MQRLILTLGAFIISGTHAKDYCPQTTKAAKDSMQQWQRDIK